MDKSEDQSRLGATARLRRMRNLVARAGQAGKIYSPLGHAHVVPFRQRRAAELVDPARIEVEGARWVAVRATPGCARLLADDLGMIGFRAYCPMGRDRVLQARLGGGKRGPAVRQFPVFGCYVFVGCPQGATLSRHAHDRIEAIVGDSRGPIAIPPAAIRAINDLELAGEWDASKSWQEKAMFKRGMKVRIKGGPFAGLGAVVEAFPREMRVAVQLAVFGRSARAEVDAGQLEPT